MMDLLLFSLFSLISGLLLTDKAAIAFQNHGFIINNNAQRRVPDNKLSIQGAVRPRGNRYLEASFLDGLFQPAADILGKPNKASSSSLVTTRAVEEFVDNWNDGNFGEALSGFAENCTFDFATFSEPCVGVYALEQRLRLLSQANNFNNPQIVVIDNIVGDDQSAGIKCHWETVATGELVPSGRGAAFFSFNDDGAIQDVFFAKETSNTAGEDGLKILRVASKIIEKTGFNPYRDFSETADEIKFRDSVPAAYFQTFSRRDMKATVDVFDEMVTYDDTAFPKPFVGKKALEDHLNLCASCFPDSFTFEVDDVVESKEAACVRWHVENEGEELPFSRGCSFYEINSRGKIQDGLDFIEPSVLKPGGLELAVSSIKGQILQERARLIPLTVWLAYIFIVFFSNGILPGADATQLEERTWVEVLNLSTNFFLVAPILGLPFSPEVHPMLEGVFNLLLSWAAMFAGFLSDERRDKPNLLPMLPMVVGMQFLTSAFLLPYLAFRSTEQRTDLTKEELPRVAQVCENPLLGVLMSFVGSLSIGWAFLGRQTSFGDLAERWVSFLDLLSIDRVGSSFLVDLAIFGLFQFWLIDDDVKSRGIQEGEYTTLIAAAKFVPFFGMAAYLIMRPPLPPRGEST